ncbi:MAG: hypothetical protein AAGD25_00655 [Cyanobacteria bacterium P01_F01_bin.150]
MKINLSPNVEIAVGRLDGSHRIKVNLTQGLYFHNYLFETLLSAVDLVSKIQQVKMIDLQHWSRSNGHENLWETFLICDRTKKNKASKAHLWTGLDTQCKMWSTGGLGDQYSCGHFS